MRKRISYERPADESEKNSITLCKSKKFHADARFEYRQKYFSQLFTVCGLNNGYYVLLALF